MTTNEETNFPAPMVRLPFVNVDQFAYETSLFLLKQQSTISTKSVESYRQILLSRVFCALTALLIGMKVATVNIALDSLIFLTHSRMATSCAQRRLSSFILLIANNSFFCLIESREVRQAKRFSQRAEAPRPSQTVFG